MTHITTRLIILLTISITLLTSCGLFGSKGNSIPPKALQTIKTTLSVTTLWQKNVGGQSNKHYIKLHPYLSGNVIYAAGSGGVSALSKTTGATIWRTSVDGEVTGGVNGGENMVFVGTGDGNAVALDAQTGKVRWVERLSSEILAISPASKSRVVFRTSEGKLHALSTATGEIMWQKQRKTPILSLRGTGVPIIMGDLVITGFDNGVVTAFDLQAGNTTWEAILGSAQGRTELDRMVDIDGKIKPVGEILFASSYQGQIAGINMRTGQIHWAKGFSSYAGVDADQQGLYGSDETGLIWRLNPNNGEPTWKMNDLERRSPTAPTLVGSTIVVGDYAGFLHWINTTDGQFIARTRGDNQGYSVAPIAEGNIIYALGRGGTLTAQATR